MSELLTAIGKNGLITIAVLTIVETCILIKRSFTLSKRFEEEYGKKVK